MANEQQYVSIINDGQQDLTIKDAEARAQIESLGTQIASVDDKVPIPVDVSTLTTSSTFPKNSVIGINGVLYKAKRNTSNMPFELVVQDGAFITQVVGGVEIFIIADPTLNGDWFPWTDASVQAHLTDLDIRMAALETMNYKGRIEAIEKNNQALSQTQGVQGQQIAALQAATASVTYNGQTYTLQMIMAEMAKLMDGTVIIQSAES